MKKFLFGAIDIVNKSYKEKYVYSGYGVAFDGKGEWSFGNDYARHKIFGVDNSSSSHTDSQKKNFFNTGGKRYFWN